MPPEIGAPFPAFGELSDPRLLSASSGDEGCGILMPDVCLVNPLSNEAPMPITVSPHHRPDAASDARALEADSGGLSRKSGLSDARQSP